MIGAARLPIRDPVDISRVCCYPLAHSSATQLYRARRPRISLSNRLVRTLEAAVLAGAFATIPLTLLGEENPVPRWVEVADWTVWAIFLLEYLVIVVVGPQRIVYVKRNPLNIAVIVLSYPGLPVIFGLVRLARLVRFLRLLRLMSVTARAIGALRIIFWRRGACQ